MIGLEKSRELYYRYVRMPSDLAMLYIEKTRGCTKV